MSYVGEERKWRKREKCVEYNNIHANVHSSINVFINEPFEMSGKPKMEEARVVLGHTFMSYVAEARKWRKRVQCVEYNNIYKCRLFN